MAKKRLRDHKQQGMNRRRISGRKPMSKEEKEARKKRSEAQRIENRERLAKLKK